MISMFRGYKFPWIWYIYGDNMEFQITEKIFYRAVKQDEPFVWGSEQEEAMNLLESKFYIM